MPLCLFDREWLTVYHMNRRMDTATLWALWLFDCQEGQMRVSSRTRLMVERRPGYTGRDPQQVRLQRRRTRLRITVASWLVGAGGGLVVAWEAGEQFSLPVIGIAVIGGAAVGYLLLAVCRALARLLSAWWYRIRGQRLNRILQRNLQLAVEYLSRHSSDPQALTDLAIALYLRGDNEEALSRLKQVQQLGDPSARSFNVLAAVQAARGSWQEAVEALLTSLQQTTDDDGPPAANVAVLLAHLPQGSPGEQELHDVALSVDARALSNIAVREMKAKNTSAALGCLRQSVKQKPNYPYALANLGVLEFREGDLQNAARHLDVAARLGHNAPDFLSDLGGVLAVGNDLDGAEYILKLARKLNSQHPAATVNQGCLYVATGRYESALQQLPGEYQDEVIRTVARHAEAVAHAGLGAYNSAEECACQARDADPDHPEIATTLGTIQWQLGKYPEARELFEMVQEYAPERLAARLNLARGDIAVGRPRQALEILRQLREEHGDDLRLTFDIGAAHLMSAVAYDKEDATRTEQLLFASALDMAIEAFEACTDTTSDVVGEAHFNLGLAYYLREDYELATNHFLKAAKLLPEDWQTKFCIGTVLALTAQKAQEEHGTRPGELTSRATGLFKKARAQLQKAAEAQRPAADVFCNLGLICYQLGDHEQAINAFRRFLQMSPGAEANNNVALVYAQQGHEAYRRVEQSHWLPADRRKSLMDEAQRVLSRAIHYFYEALRSEALNAVLHCNVGLAYMLRNQRHDIERAMDHWQQMRETGGAWAAQQFRSMMEVVDSKETAKVRFMDSELEMHPIEVTEAIIGLPPLLGEVGYVVLPVMDHGQWQLEAVDSRVQAALELRNKLTRARQRMHAMAQ